MKFTKVFSERACVCGEEQGRGGLGECVVHVSAGC